MSSAAVIPSSQAETPRSKGGATSTKTQRLSAEGANTVSIGGATRALTGVNIPRGTNDLVAYTYASNRTSTPTNQYGTEVAVSGGKVVQVNNRTATGGTAGTAVPANGYVLSGHAAAAPFYPANSAQWLLDNAKVGTAVTVGRTTSPQPPPQPEPTGDRLPRKVTSLWHFRYSPAPNIRDWPVDVQTQVNHVVLGLAQGGAGNGTMEYSPSNGQSVADHAADTKALRARGVNVVMGFGGSNSGIKLTSEAHVTQALDFFAKMRDTYGINGYDVDLESPDLWTKEALLSLAKQSRARFGQDWVIGLTTGLWGDREARWYEAARYMTGWYDYFAPMEYDYPESRDDRLVNIWLDKIDRMKAGGVPADKIIMGTMMAPDPGYPATQNPSTIVKAWQAAVKRDPELRGYFMWEDKLGKARNWDLFRTMRAANLG